MSHICSEMETVEPRPTTRRDLLPLLAAGITVLLWTSAFIAISAAGRDISPGALTLGRLAVGATVLGGPALRAGARPRGRDWALIALCGVAWFGVYNVALNEGERHLDAGVAAIVVNVGPILIAALAGLLLGEGLPRGLVAGAAIAFSGVVIIGLATSNGSHLDRAGIALCLVAAAGYAVGVVSQKPVLARIPPLVVTWLACTVGCVVCLPFAPTLVHDIAHARPVSIALVIYLGAFPTAIAFTTWAYALSHTTAGRMGSTTYVVPALAILMGWAILGEQPAPLAILGGALCLAGVYVTRRPARGP